MTHQRMRTPQAAAYCGSSVSTLNKYRLTGEGPDFIKIGRAVVYDQADLDKWLSSRKRRSTADNGGDYV